MKKLGFGLMRLPKTDPNVNKSVDEAAVLQMMREFIDNGFTYFDTAYMYHSYNSENVVGRTLVKNFPRDAYTLADKLPTMFLKEEADMQRIFEEQLAKCCVDYFDYYMLHDVNGSNYDQTVQRLGAFDFISKLKDEGRVREIGFSFHGGEELLDRILTEHPYVDFVQLQINYLDWEDEGVQSRRCYECAVRHGKKVIICDYLYSMGGVQKEGLIGLYYYGNRVGFTKEIDAGEKETGAVLEQGRVEWYRKQNREPVDD